MTPSIHKAVIVGPGLIGGSLGMALKARGLAGRVVGVGRRQLSLDRALAVGAVDETSMDLLSAADGADVIVLATAVGLAARQAVELLPRMKSGAVLTDVGSVKAALCRDVSDAFSRATPGVSFVGGHPLAGSEQRGVDAARANLFENAVCILTPDPSTDPDSRGLGLLRAMWKGVGSRVVEMPPDRHDALLSDISHLPHVIAACLVNAASDEALQLAARGFLDTTRIASGDPGLWVDICMANRSHLTDSLSKLNVRIEEFTQALGRGDAEAVRRFLAVARDRRDARL